MSLNCDWMLLQNIDKAKLYKLKKKILQNSCFQSESNRDPIRAYQKKGFVGTLSAALGESPDF